PPRSRWPPSFYLPGNSLPLLPPPTANDRKTAGGQAGPDDQGHRSRLGNRRHRCRSGTGYGTQGEHHVGCVGAARSIAGGIVIGSRPTCITDAVKSGSKSCPCHREVRKATEGRRDRVQGSKTSRLHAAVDEPRIAK